MKAGLTYGETDDFGFRPVAGKVHLHDLHATMLHLLGLDHERLTYRHAGRDYRLTDVDGTRGEGDPRLARGPKKGQEPFFKDGQRLLAPFSLAAALEVHESSGSSKPSPASRSAVSDATQSISSFVHGL